MKGLGLVLYNNTTTLCVHACLSVCPTWDTRNGRRYRHAAYTILKSFAWQMIQTPFWGYTMRGSREKGFRRFSSVTLQIPCRHGYFSGYPRQDETCTLQQSFRNILEGMSWRTRPQKHGSSYTNSFSTLYDARSREQAFESFSPLRAARFFQVTLRRMNLAHYMKAFVTFLNGMRWRIRPPHHGYYSCYCYIREWDICTSQYEKLITR